MKKIILDRQGDLAFVKLEALPEGLTKVDFTGEYTLALGEGSGNSHVLVAEKPTLELFTDERGRHYFKVGEKAEVTHRGPSATHRVFTFEPGIYVNDVQVEYDEAEDRKVQD